MKCLYNASHLPAIDSKGKTYEEQGEATGEIGFELHLRRICPRVKGLPQEGELLSQDIGEQRWGVCWDPCYRAMILTALLGSSISKPWELVGNANSGAFCRPTQSEPAPCV